MKHLLFLILFIIYINIIKGLSTKSPDLLKFVLNIKPGIREPSNKLQKNKTLIPLKSTFQSNANAQVLINKEGKVANRNASINSSGGGITLENKIIKKWKHTKIGILESTNNTQNNLLKNKVNSNSSSTVILEGKGGESAKLNLAINKGKGYSTNATSLLLLLHYLIISQSENYANEGLIESSPNIKTSILPSQNQLPYSNQFGNVETATNKNRLITSTLIPSSSSSTTSSSPISSTLSLLPSSQLPQYYNSNNSPLNYSPQYISPPAISPYSQKTEKGTISVPSGDAYEASVLEANLGEVTKNNLITTNIPPIKETIPLIITKTTTKVPPCGPDVLFVLDSTGSVRNVYEAQRNYILNVAQQMDISPNGQHVGLIIYSSKIRQRIIVNLNDLLTKEKFIKIVQELPYHGGITATGHALKLTIKALENKRPNKRTIIILFTDGYTYDEWEVESKELLTKGVEVIVAGEFQSYLKSVLDRIAGDPNKVLIGAENKSKVLDLLRCR
ncbi:VWFA domain-containing protein [Meloidogyne graminicola]|uniref:VWFA domain-containing protein n=1 Tax=Meloidogyne graminicola TaxID=189291 RepID=A0A8S9ZTS1_9BILA|nr:VWFA domain-containing protein [Meloidogyne graminicola]